MNFLRKVAEYVARDRILCRRLPTEFGRRPIFVSPDSQLKYLRPGRTSFDPLLLDFVQEFVKAASVVWDVGANVGVLSVAAAHRARDGFVLAVEPDPLMGHVLSKTRSHVSNRDLRLEVLQSAVADRRDILALAMSARGRARNALVEFDRAHGNARGQVNVPTVTLDEMAGRFPPPTILKIDVEGAEAAVLAGGAEVLARHRPTILIEVGVETNEAVTACLAKAGYRFFDAGMPPSKRVPIPRCVFNTVALPD